MRLNVINVCALKLNIILHMMSIPVYIEFLKIENAILENLISV